MPIKKWALAWLLTAFLLFCLFAAVQWLKGKGVEDAIAFGALWGFISASIYQGTKIYYFKKKIHCVICNDLSTHS